MNLAHMIKQLDLIDIKSEFLNDLEERNKELRERIYNLKSKRDSLNMEIVSLERQLLVNISKINRVSK